MIDDRVVVIGLGGNQGGDAAIVGRFARARAALAAWGSTRASPIYRSAPIGGPRQPDYLNAALAIVMDPAPEPVELISGVLEIEHLLGRERRGEIASGPRAIDLDVLLWGRRTGAWPGPPALVVPHPRLAHRRFALAPAIDLVGGDAVLPGATATLEDLWRRTADQRVDPTDLRL